MARAQRSAAAAPERRDLRKFAIAAVLVVLTFAVFAQVLKFDFISLDDPQFVTGNDYVKAGLTASSVKWAFTSADIGYYPLTWLSHMTDVQLFQLDAGAHHRTALLLHAASTVVLFFTLLQLTSALWPSAFAAALFAIHPMHVESVAWVAERKDTLSTLFGLLALAVYVKRPRHWLVATCLIASLLSKQMLVTLPVVLLAIDWWSGRWAAEAEQGVSRLRVPLALIREKLPLLAVSVAGAVVAIAGQRQLGAMQTLQRYPLSQRISNALVSCAIYLGKLLVPIRLAVFYPMTHRGALETIASAILLIAISYAAWRLRHRAPYVIAGWIWFVVTLLPVIGIIQIGRQAMADRYSYVPSIGLFIALAWAAYDFVPRRVAFAAGVVIVAVFAAVAVRQTSYWHDTLTLFNHAVEVSGPYPLADYALGQELARTNPDAGIPLLRRAIAETEAEFGPGAAMNSDNVVRESHMAIATALLMKAGYANRDEALKLIDEAEREYRTYAMLDPNDRYGRAQYDIALAEDMRRRLTAPGTDAQSLMTAGLAQLGAGNTDAAIAQFQRAAATAPQLPEPHVNLGIAYLRASRNADALRELRTAESLNALKANEFFTAVQRLPADTNNLRSEIARLSK